MFHVYNNSTLLLHLYIHTKKYLQKPLEAECMSSQFVITGTAGEHVFVI